MAVYYIDPTVITGGDGSLSSPFNTWASVTWAAGNTYLQKENTEFKGTVTITAGGTSESTRVVVGTYEASTGDQITDNTRHAKINANAGQYGIIVSGIRNYVRVDNLEVYGARHASTATGIYMGTGAGTNFDIWRCKVYNVRNSDGSVGSCGIKLFSDNARIKWNEVFDMGDDGVYAEGDNIEIAYNNIYRVSIDGVGGDCIQMADTFLSSNAPWIHHNYLDHSNKDSKQCFIITSGGAGGSSGGGVVEYNVMIGFPNAATHKPLYLGNAAMKAQHNYIENGLRNIDADSNSAGSVIRSNIIVNNSEVVNTNGIILTAANCSVYNNTIINKFVSPATACYGIQVGNLANTVIKNNIVTGWKYGIRIHTSNPATEEYNCLYNNTTNKVNESLNSVSLGTGSITTNPALTSSYTFKTTSSVYRAGTFVNFCGDVLGNIFNNPPSMGAYEYISTRGVR